MEFEWDAKKRQSNLEKHGIDFFAAREIWSGAVIEIPSKNKNGDPRIIAYGYVQDHILAVVFTWRETKRRLISARPAKRDERQRYNLALGRSVEE